MKKMLSVLFSLVLIGTVIGQEKYAVPEVPIEKKLSRTYFQFWGVFAVGIEFAKTHGVSPYEYGKYMGKVFAPSWNQDGGFESYVKGSIYNWENSRTDEDKPMTITENEDGSVSIFYPIQVIKKYFSGEKSYTSFEEIMSCMEGVNEVIADYMGVEVKIEVTEEDIIFNYKKK